MKIYRRTYDEPLDNEGNKKHNRFLGDFKIVQTIFKDMYSSQRIGLKDGKHYLIDETEVSYSNGGTRFRITKLKI